MQLPGCSSRHALLLAAVCLVSVLGGKPARAQNSVWTTQERNVASRDFYALVTAEDSPDAMRAMASDTALKALRDKRDAKLQEATSTCHDAPCFDDAFRWSPEEIAAAGAALKHLAQSDPAFRRFIETKLRSTNKFALYDHQPAEDLIVSAWNDAANAMNRILSVYAEGKPPLYARIDAMRYDVKSPEFLEFLQASSVLASEQKALPAFFSSAMKYAVLVLVANDRPDAGRFEPLDAENRAAITLARSIDWKRFPYSVILVPGEGPEQGDVELSPLGRIRVEIAVALYRQGKAPFLLVSGGTVHPMLTKYDEAIEMRKELEEQWHIPASAILIDPYARHTTTNLRNAVREVIRYGMPRDKPMLIASDAAQIGMIVTPAFEARCLREMHLRPWSKLDRVSPTESSMLPNVESLAEDAIDDPLDP